MAVVRKTFDLHAPAASEWLRAAAGQSGPRIAALPSDHDREAVVALVAACRRTGAGMAARLADVGLIAELASRDARIVRAWLATGKTAGVTGLVSLVEATGGDGRRFSIGWLLVHPDARRRGIGTALVRHALLAARDRGAREVFVETLGDWADAIGFWHATDGGIQRAGADRDRGTPP